MINAIRSNPVSLLVLLLALAAQVPHALTVFYKASGIVSDTNWWLSLTFAIALESAVLMFVIHGWHRFSYVFAASSILVNMAYYDMLPDVFVKVLVSVILPVSIACYSHLVADDSDTSTFDINWRAYLSRMKNVVTTRGRTTSLTTIDLPEIVTPDMSDMSHVGDSDNVGDSDIVTIDTANVTTDDTKDMSQPDKLTAAQRRAQLSELLDNDTDVPPIDIDKLASTYSVTPRTIRRDIDKVFSTNGHSV